MGCSESAPEGAKQKEQKSQEVAQQKEQKSQEDEQQMDQKDQKVAPTLLDKMNMAVSNMLKRNI